MRFASIAAIVSAFSLLCTASFAQVSKDVNPRAALIEVVPPAATVQSPAAVQLTDRLIRKHVLLLQHPSLMDAVIARDDVKKLKFASQDDPAKKLLAATRVRVIADSNLIEVMINPEVAGDEAPTLAEAVVNQHLQNQREVGQNVLLERSVMLNNLKQRYQFRKDELAKDLREKMVQLSIDGTGTPGRLSATEAELTNLMQQKFGLSRDLEEAKHDGDKPKQDQLQSKVRSTDERIDELKTRLAEMTKAMQQYLTLKDDEQTTREMLKQVNEQLDQVSQNVNATPVEVRWLCKPSRG